VLIAAIATAAVCYNKRKASPSIFDSEIKNIDIKKTQV